MMMMTAKTETFTARAGMTQHNNRSEKKHKEMYDKGRKDAHITRMLKFDIVPPQPPSSMIEGPGPSSIPASPTYHKIRTSSGDSGRIRAQMMGLGE